MIMIDTAPGAETATGTVFPFSAISGAVSSMPPSDVAAPPVKAASASSESAANAWNGSRAAAAAPAPMTRASRLVKFIIVSLDLSS